MRRLWLALCLLTFVVAAVPVSALDSFVNFGIVTLPAGGFGTADPVTISLTPGDGAKLPATGSWNAPVFNSSDYGSADQDPQREVLRCARSVDTLTCARAQESTSNVAHNATGKIYKLDATLTAKTLNTDLVPYQMPNFSVINAASTQSLGQMVIGFSHVSFTGIDDPIMWWGYNQQNGDIGQPGGGPANHQRFYWNVEGNYYDGVHTGQTETYLTRFDTTGTTYRPFIIGAYDGFSNAAFQIDTLSLSKKDGTGSVMFWDTANRNVQLGSDVPFLALGNNRYAYKQVSTTPGAYVGLIKLNASNQVELGESTATVTAAGPINGAGVIGFGSSGVNDVGFSRSGAGIVQLGNGTAGDKTGTLLTKRIEMYGDRFVVRRPTDFTDVLNIYGPSSGSTDARFLPSQSTGSIRMTTAAGSTNSFSVFGVADGSGSLTAFGGPVTMVTGGVYRWNNDTGLSRTGANALALGNGTAADATGSLALATLNASSAYQINGVLAASSTAPTIPSGGCTSPAVTWANGTQTFLLTLGSSCTGVKTLTLTLPAAAHFWACTGENNTNDAQQAANHPVARATSATAVIVTNYSRTTGLQADFTASDTLLLSCSGG